MANNFPILITTCIHSSAPLTQISETKVRLSAVIEGLKFLSQHIDVEREIVICDGSGYNFNEEMDYINSVFSNVEVLYFKNDDALVSLKGKGFGEGQIIKYALQESVYLKSAEHFIKLTGKLWVSNILECEEKYNGFAYFMIDNPIKPLKVDTKFYIVQKKFFNNTLLEVYESVDDLNGYYLEHAYFEQLINSTGNCNVFSGHFYPEIFGLSGSTGKSYAPDLKKMRTKNFKYKLKLYIGTLLRIFK